MTDKSILLKYTESTKQSCTLLVVGIIGISIYLVIFDKIPSFINNISKMGIIGVLTYTIFIIINATYPIIHELKMDVLETKYIYLQRTIIQNIFLIMSILALMYYFV
jgi:hypothetical protein